MANGARTRVHICKVPSHNQRTSPVEPVAYSSFSISALCPDLHLAANYHKFAVVNSCIRVIEVPVIARIIYHYRDEFSVQNGPVS